jgi:hypothetical protein
MTDDVEIIGNLQEPEIKRGPGRPKATPVGQATPLNAAKPGAKQRKRVSDMARQILPDTSKMDQNYVYRVVNEGMNGVGIQGLLDRGYEVVHSDQSLVTEEAGKAASLTSQVQIVANASSGEKGVLMRIHKDYHAEDQADKQRVVAQTETMMNLVSQDLKGAYAPKDEKGNQIAIKIG